MRGNSSTLSDTGSGLLYPQWPPYSIMPNTHHEAIAWQAASNTEYPCSKKFGAIRSSTFENNAGNGRCVSITNDFCSYQL
jgi:hypothetical protein